jgi:hypothetical protein
MINLHCFLVALVVLLLSELLIASLSTASHLTTSLSTDALSLMNLDDLPDYHLPLLPEDADAVSKESPSESHPSFSLIFEVMHQPADTQLQHWTIFLQSIQTFLFKIFTRRNLLALRFFEVLKTLLQQSDPSMLKGLSETGEHLAVSEYFSDCVASSLKLVRNVSCLSKLHYKLIKLQYSNEFPSNFWHQAYHIKRSFLDVHSTLQSISFLAGYLMQSQCLQSLNRFNSIFHFIKAQRRNFKNAFSSKMDARRAKVLLLLNFLGFIKHFDSFTLVLKPNDALDPISLVAATEALSSHFRTVDVHFGPYFDSAYFDAMKQVLNGKTCASLLRHFVIDYSNNDLFISEIDDFFKKQHFGNLHSIFIHVNLLDQASLPNLAKIYSTAKNSLENQFDKSVEKAPINMSVIGPTFSFAWRRSQQLPPISESDDLEASSRVYTTASLSIKSSSGLAFLKNLQTHSLIDCSILSIEAISVESDSWNDLNLLIESINFTKFFITFNDFMDMRQERNIRSLLLVLECKNTHNELIFTEASAALRDSLQEYRASKIVFKNVQQAVRRRQSSIL